MLENKHEYGPVYTTIRILKTFRKGNIINCRENLLTQKISQARRLIPEQITYEHNILDELATNDRKHHNGTTTSTKFQTIKNIKGRCMATKQNSSTTQQHQRPTRQQTRQTEVSWQVSKPQTTSTTTGVTSRRNSRRKKTRKAKRTSCETTVHSAINSERILIYFICFKI